MRDVFDPHMTVEARGVFHSCLSAVDDAPLPRGYHSLQQLADAVQNWYLAELARRDVYPCHVAKSTWETLDVKWINAQEVTTSKHELRSFCDRLAVIPSSGRDDDRQHRARRDALCEGWFDKVGWLHTGVCQ